MCNNGINIYAGSLFFLLNAMPSQISHKRKKVNIESGEFLNYVKFLPIIVMCGEKYIVIKLF